MRNPVLIKMANNDFFKFLKDFIKILIFRKVLNFGKNRDNGKVFPIFFPNFQFKDFSTI